MSKIQTKKNISDEGPEAEKSVVSKGGECLRLYWKLNKK